MSASKLPSGRGFGEPMALTIDLKADTKIISCFPFFDGNVIIASDTGHGFKTQTKSLIAQTKSGKQIINVKGENKAKLCKKIDGDTIAVVGNNRKLIVYSIKEIPELNKGKGVILQRYKDGTLSDIITFNLEDGISFFSNLSTDQEQINNQIPKGEFYLREVDEPLVIPINTRIRFLITGNDVIHSWWVPDFAVKQDAVPGFINTAWTNVPETGIYRGACTELCGIKHAFMPITVRVVSEEDYQEWLNGAKIKFAKEIIEEDQFKKLASK